MTGRGNHGPHITGFRLLAGLLAVVVIATACSDSSGDAASEDRRERIEGGRFATGNRDTDGAAGSLRSGTDEEESFAAPADEPAEEPAEEAAREPADSSGESGFDRTPPGSADDADAAFADGPASGGLFESQPDLEPDPRRLDANTFENYGVRPFVDPDDDPLSTFALDVDTGSYTIARRWLSEGVLPDPDSVRVEEFVNYFDYDYDAPRSGLDISIDGGPSPFDDGDVLVRVGIQAARIDDHDRPPAALTFVVDTSGSMDRDDRLGLVKDALEELVEELDDDDTVAIVTYGSSSDVVLEPTFADDVDRILDAIDDLRPGGSTNLEAGLQTGYELAEFAFVEEGINRVILASDGVANVGTVDAEILADQVHDRAVSGIQLVTIGVGMGNFNDVTMERLADRGDGFYAYVDTREEADRLFEDQLIATLAPVALDARIQVEWDDHYVDSYRLIGFENRGVLDSQFRSEDVDAGELSSGHTVTAIYELELDRDAERDVELGEVTLRWQDPGDRVWIETTEDIDFDDVEPDWDDATTEMRLATVVAAWAEVLRGSGFADGIDPEGVADEAARLADELGTDQVSELADLTALAMQIS